MLIDIVSVIISLFLVLAFLSPLYVVYKLWKH
jgi:hypothetical protein